MQARRTVYDESIQKFLLASVLSVILAEAASATTITADGSRSAIRASVEVFSSSSAIEAVYPVP
jgi:hypothetical protein